MLCENMLKYPDVYKHPCGSMCRPCKIKAQSGRNRREDAAAIGSKHLKRQLERKYKIDLFDHFLTTTHDPQIFQNWVPSYHMPQLVPLVDQLLGKDWFVQPGIKLPPGIAAATREHREKLWETYDKRMAVEDNDTRTFRPAYRPKSEDQILQMPDLARRYRLAKMDCIADKRFINFLELVVSDESIRGTDSPNIRADKRYAKTVRGNLSRTFKYTNGILPRYTVSSHPYGEMQAFRKELLRWAKSNLPEDRHELLFVGCIREHGRGQSDENIRYSDTITVNNAIDAPHQYLLENYGYIKYPGFLPDQLWFGPHLHLLIRGFTTQELAEASAHAWSDYRSRLPEGGTEWNHIEFTKHKNAPINKTELKLDSKYTNPNLPYARRIKGKIRIDRLSGSEGQLRVNEYLNQYLFKNQNTPNSMSRIFTGMTHESKTGFRGHGQKELADQSKQMHANNVRVMGYSLFTREDIEDYLRIKWTEEGYDLTDCKYFWIPHKGSDHALATKIVKRAKGGAKQGLALFAVKFDTIDTYKKARQMCGGVTQTLFIDNQMLLSDRETLKKQLLGFSPVPDTPIKNEDFMHHLKMMRGEIPFDPGALSYALDSDQQDQLFTPDDCVAISEQNEQLRKRRDAFLNQWEGEQTAVNVMQEEIRKAEVAKKRRSVARISKLRDDKSVGGSQVDHEGHYVSSKDYS